MSSVDKTKLEEALRKLSFEGAQGMRDLYWGKCLENGPVLHGSDAKNLYLCINSVGAISIPITLQDIDKLKEASHPHVSCADDAEIQSIKKNPTEMVNLSSTVKVNLTNSSTSTCFGNAIRDVTILALNQVMGFDLKDLVVIKVILTKLTLCSAGGQSVGHIDSPKKNLGTFGKLVLQVPVEGGFDGGRLKVEKKPDGTGLFYDFDRQSDRFYHCAIFFDGCKYEWEPIIRGNMVALDYELVWRPASALLTDSTLSLSTFLSAIKLIKESLISWSCVDNQANVALPAVIKTEDSSPSSLETSSSYNLNEATENQESPSSVTNGSSDKLLIIQLQEKYCETNFGFSSLRGSDRQLSHILQSIDFIDVHLAVVKSSCETNNKKPIIGVMNPKGLFHPSNHCQIVHWIYPHNSVPQFQFYQLDLSTHLLGEPSFQLFVPPPGSLVQKFRSPVIVIQPRHQSVHRCCLLKFDAILDHLEIRLSSFDSKVTRLQSLECLGQILSYCQDEPLKVWDVPAAEAAERTRRLLTICKDLESQKDGLQLIQILGEDVVKIPKSEQNSSQVFYEGVRDESVARSIVQLLLNAGGWQVFAGPILLRLITPTRFQQLKSFATIIISLVEHQCVHGALDVAHQIFTTMSTYNDIAQRCEEKDVDAYVDAIIKLEASPEAATDGSVVDQLLLPLFDWLSCYQKCRLLITLQANNYSRLKNLPSCTQLYQKLAQILLEYDLCKADGGVQEMFDELISAYVKLGNLKIYKKFIDCVFWPPDSKASNNNVWLEGVIRHTLSSSFAKLVLEEYLTKRIDVVKRLIKIPSNRERETERWDKSIDIFLALLRLEWIPELADGSRLESFSPIYLKMSVERLQKLIVDLFRRGSSYTAIHPSGQNLLLQMSQSLLLLEGKELPPSPSTFASFEILKCFVDLPELDLAYRFIEKLCLCDKWNPLHKISLFQMILRSPEISSKLCTTDRTDCSVEITLLNSWFFCLIQLLDIRPAPTHTNEEGGCYLRSNIASYFLYYFVKEKSKFQGAQNEKADRRVLLSPQALIDKMSTERIGYLIWDLYESDIKDQPSLKDIPIILEFYRDLCQQFVSRDLTELLASSNTLIVEVSLSLLWLGDEVPMSIFTSRVLALHPANELNLTIKKIATCPRVLRLIESCSQARGFLRRVLEQRIHAITMELENLSELRWQMPDASLHDNRVVEKFLRSRFQQMIYANFCNKEEAQQFACEVSSIKCSVNGCSVTVEITGEDFDTKCHIMKVEPSSSLNQSMKEALLREKMEMDAILGTKLEVNDEITEFEEDSEDALTNPAKKSKRDVRITDESD